MTCGMMRETTLISKRKETFHDVRDQVEEIQVIEAINGNVTNWEIPGNDRKDPSVFLNDTQDEIRRLVSGIPRMKKVNVILVCMMVKDDPNSKTGERMYRTVHARSRTHVIHTNFDENYEVMKDHALNNLERIKNMASGWRLHHIIKLVVQVTRYEPLAGNRYMIPLLRKLMGKRAIANMKNNDNECFKWAVTRVLHPVSKDLARITKELRKQSEKYD